MPRTSQRGGPETRARIRETANRLFMERGYDAVTVAEVAREAGVSSATVFNHFPRKEDLFLDRTEDAVQLLRSAVRDGGDPLATLRSRILRLVEERHPLSGVDERSVPFYRTVANSPALVARAREIAAELQSILAEELRAADFPGDADLLASLLIAGYSTVMVGTAGRMLGGEQWDAVLVDHRARAELLFDALERGFAHPE